jgi:hypothetical protein
MPGLVAQQERFCARTNWCEEIVFPVVRKVHMLCACLELLQALVSPVHPLLQQLVMGTACLSVTPPSGTLLAPAHASWLAHCGSKGSARRLMLRHPAQQSIQAAPHPLHCERSPHQQRRKLACKVYKGYSICYVSKPRVSAGMSSRERNLPEIMSHLPRSCKTAIWCCRDPQVNVQRVRSGAVGIAAHRYIGAGNFATS